MKRLNGGREPEQTNKGRVEGSVIMEVDEETYQELLIKYKLSVGCKKCPVYNHVSVERCFKC